MYGGVTPIMYSAYWNDTNTIQELINLGADIRKRDRYKLWVMPYAITNNSIDVVKLFIANGVSFNEVKLVQRHLHCPAINDDMTVVTDINNFKKIIFPKLTKCETNYEESAGDISDIVEYLLFWEDNVDILKLALKNGLTLDTNHLYESYAHRLREKRYYFKKHFRNILNFEEPLKVVLDNNVNMDLFVSKDEVIKQYTDQFKDTLCGVDTLAQYIEHSNDFIMGEEIFGVAQL